MGLVHRWKGGKPLTKLLNLGLSPLSVFLSIVYDSVSVCLDLTCFECVLLCFYEVLFCSLQLFCFSCKLSVSKYIFMFKFFICVSDFCVNYYDLRSKYLFIWEKLDYPRPPYSSFTASLKLWSFFYEISNLCVRANAPKASPEKPAGMYINYPACGTF